MQFFTSYFGKVNQIKQERPDMIFISISRWDRRWKGWKLKSLAPSEDLLRKYKKGLCTKEEYTDIYIKQLDVHCPSYYYTHLYEKFGNKDICFLCYERPDQFCHRHIVADWFTEYGFKCKEWGQE